MGRIQGDPVHHVHACHGKAALNGARYIAERLDQQFLLLGRVIMTVGVPGRVIGASSRISEVDQIVQYIDVAVHAYAVELITGSDDLPGRLRGVEIGAHLHVVAARGIMGMGHITIAVPYPGISVGQEDDIGIVSVLMSVSNFLGPLDGPLPVGSRGGRAHGSVDVAVKGVGIGVAAAVAACCRIPAAFIMGRAVEGDDHHLDKRLCPAVVEG